MATKLYTEHIYSGDKFECEIEPGDAVLYISDNTWAGKEPDLDVGIVRFIVTGRYGEVLVTSYQAPLKHQLCRTKDVVVLPPSMLPEKFRHEGHIKQIMDSGYA